MVFNKTCIKAKSIKHKNTIQYQYSKKTLSNLREILENILHKMSRENEILQKLTSHTKTRYLKSDEIENSTKQILRTN